MFRSEISSLDSKIQCSGFLCFFFCTLKLNCADSGSKIKDLNHGSYAVEASGLLIFSVVNKCLEQRSVGTW